VKIREQVFDGLLDGGVLLVGLERLVDRRHALFFVQTVVVKIDQLLGGFLLAPMKCVQVVDASLELSDK